MIINLLPVWLHFLTPRLPLKWWNSGWNKSCYMNLDEAIKEMEGKICLLDNKKFIYYAGAMGIYYLAFLGFLTHIVIRSGGFH